MPKHSYRLDWHETDVQFTTKEEGFSSPAIRFTATSDEQARAIARKKWQSICRRNSTARGPNLERIKYISGVRWPK